MIRWIPYTFVRTLFFFIAGILLGIFAPDVVPVTSALVLLLSFLGTYCVMFLGNHSVIVNPGYLALPAVLLAGYIHVLNQTESRDPDHFGSIDGKVSHMVVTVSGYAEEKENTWKVAAKTSAVKIETGWHNVSGQILLYFLKKDFPQPFNYGQKLLISGVPNPVSLPGNPGEFDYKKFLRYKNIYHQQFVRAGQAVVLGHERENPIRYYALQCRLWANEVIKKYVVADESSGIGSALVLGVTDGLNNELLTAYAASGAMHVLAVSGLHVSIIYLIILFLLKPLTKTKKGNWILAVISLLFLWSYAFVTGLSPSVLRAVTMFTFIAIAKATSRDTSIFNTLAASAFCILLFDPFLIMSVGFQLSYLAVIGIVYMEPLLREAWQPNAWITNEAWKITRVSIAAQLATLSLTLLYFHQFPNYFLLTNLLVVPLSFLILIFGLVLLAVAFVPVIAGVVGYMLDLSIQLMNLIVTGIKWLPYALIENVNITTFQSWILMVVIVLFIMFFQWKKFNYLRYSFFCIVLFAAAQWSHYLEKPVPQLTIYKVPGHTAIDLSDDDKVFFVGDQLTDQQISFHVKPNRILSGANTLMPDGTPFIRNIPSAKLIRWNAMNILLIMNKNYKPAFSNDIAVVVVSNESVPILADIGRHYPKALIVIDSSNSYYYADNLLRQGRNLGITCYSVLHDGAWSI